MKGVAPIFASYFAGFYILIMLVAFDWPGRATLALSLSIVSYFGFRHAINHHSLKFGGSLSAKRMNEARDFVISSFQDKGVKH